MLRSFLLLSALFLADPAPSSQADRTSAPLDADVRSLIRRLNDERLSERDAAEKMLLDLGPDVLESLPAAPLDCPAEVKERLTRIRTILEKQAGQSVLQPSRVVLAGELTLADALRSIAQQTGNRFTGQEGRSGTIRASFPGTPFWEALDQVLDQAALNVSPYGGQPGTLVLVSRPRDERPRYGAADYRGVFRFEAVRVESQLDLRNPLVGGLRLTIRASWEPRLKLVSLRQPLDQVEAVDDCGSQLPIGKQGGVLDASVESGVSAVDLPLPLALPDRQVHTISRLRGTLTALVPGRVETFEFTDLLAANEARQQRAGVTVTLERVRRNLDVYEVRIRVRFEDAAGALESHRGWIYGNEAYLVDASGTRHAQAGLQTTQQREQEVGIAYLFELDETPANYRFVYKTPAVILRVPVAYELREIRLP